MLPSNRSVQWAFAVPEIEAIKCRTAPYGWLHGAHLQGWTRFHSLFGRNCRHRLRQTQRLF